MLRPFHRFPTPRERKLTHPHPVERSKRHRTMDRIHRAFPSRHSRSTDYRSLSFSLSLLTCTVYMENHTTSHHIISLPSVRHTNPNQHQAPRSYSLYPGERNRTHPPSTDEANNSTSPSPFQFQPNSQTCFENHYLYLCLCLCLCLCLYLYLCLIA